MSVRLPKESRKLTDCATIPGSNNLLECEMAVDGEKRKYDLQYEGPVKAVVNPDGAVVKVFSADQVLCNPEQEKSELYAKSLASCQGRDPGDYARIRLLGKIQTPEEKLQNRVNRTIDEMKSILANIKDFSVELKMFKEKTDGGEIEGIKAISIRKASSKEETIFMTEDVVILTKDGKNIDFSPTNEQRAAIQSTLLQIVGAAKENNSLKKG